MFDVEKVRKDFPILAQSVREKPLVYFDNAATTQKPQIVIDAMSAYYQTSNSNVRRGVHLLAEKATEQFEAARQTVQQFIHAATSDEIVFVKGTTEAINLVAHGLTEKINNHDEIVISILEHHANFVPWQQLCKKTGATLKVVPLLANGELDLSAYAEMLSPRTKFVALSHVSNTLGTINPIAKMISLAHEYGAQVFIDGAQAAPHLKIDVQQLNCDFYAFSGHKMYGPTGIGILYGKYDALNNLPPFLYGGDMILSVSIEGTLFQKAPLKFEAGTPPIAEAIGLAATISYLNNLNLSNIAKYETQLRTYAEQRLAEIPGVKIIGTALEKAAIVSFVMDGIHPHDVGTLLDQQGVAVRTGHHCTMPLIKSLKLAATTRASFAFYNTKAEIDIFIDALLELQQWFKG